MKVGLGEWGHHPNQVKRDPLCSLMYLWSLEIIVTHHILENNSDKDIFMYQKLIDLERGYDFYSGWWL